MLRRYIFILAGITVVVITLMAFLHFSTDNPRYRKNGFVRIVLKGETIKLHVFNEQIIDIAGMDAGKLYLVTRQPDRLLVTDTGFHNIQPVHLNIDVTDKLRSNFTTTLLDSTLYIAGANVPGITRYDLTTKNAQVYKVDRTFSRFALINDHTAILRGFNASFDDELFRKMDMPAAAYIEESGITEKTAGGGFVTDGMLHYDRQTGCLVFNFFYCNRLLFLDTNLNLLHTATTVDTFKTYTASAKSVKTSEGVSFTFSKPPELLSLHSCVNNGKLFVYSRLKADNEAPEVFRQHTVIDVYDIASGKYTGSLYIPMAHQKRMLKFSVFNNLLIGIYPNSMIIYQIPTHI